MRVYRGWGEPTKVSFTPEAQQELDTGEGLVEGRTVEIVRKSTMPPWVLPVAAGAAGLILLGLGWSAFRPRRSFAGRLGR